MAAGNSVPGGIMAESRKAPKGSGTSVEPKAMLTMGEACRLLNVHSNTLRRWTATGLIKAHRIGIGTHRRYRTEDVAALLVEQNRSQGTDVDDQGRVL